MEFKDMQVNHFFVRVDGLLICFVLSSARVHIELFCFWNNVLAKYFILVSYLDQSRDVKSCFVFTSFSPQVD